MNEGLTRRCSAACRRPLNSNVMVTPDQSPLTVADLMHKHDMDWLPVVENQDSRRMIGVIRSERMLRCLVAHMSDSSSSN